MTSVHGLVSTVLSKSPKSVHKIDRTFVVEVSNLDDNTQLLSSNGREIVEKGVMTVESCLETLEISECLEFLIYFVEVDEDLENCRRVLTNFKVSAVGSKTKNNNRQDNMNGS